ncbi:MAG: DUF6159 family protein [Chloroflexi bacterium]|nr:DUF6159 family protein [Chloroflexota bacterium]
MFKSFSTSWTLIKSSANVLKADKELIIFPILSTFSVLILSAVFFVPMLLVGFFNSVSQQGLQLVDYLILFLFYILQYLIIFLSNTALVGAAMIRIRGGDPTVRDGLKIAFARFVPIFFYAMIAATVGVLLSFMKNKSNRLGGFVVSLIGFVWNVATFLVVPILAVEDVGPIDAIKRSVSYLKKTWGEQLVGSFSISTVFNLIIFGMILLAVAAIALVAYISGPIWIMIAIGILLILAILILSLVNSALTGIYTAAVYQYATTGEAGKFFDPTVVQDAFHPANR